MREISAKFSGRGQKHLRTHPARRKSRGAERDHRSPRKTGVPGQPAGQGGTGADQKQAARDVPGVASEIVHRAAAILEEEIAAGIVAAKQIEARFVKHDDVSDAAPQEIVERFRKDAHEMADVIIDFLSAITKNLGLLADHLASNNGAAKAFPAGSDQHARGGVRRRSNNGGNNHKGRPPSPDPRE